MTLMTQRAAMLGGKACHNNIRCPGPGHSTHDRSLLVSFKKAAPEGFLVHSHAGDDFQVCRDHVRQCLGLPAPKVTVNNSLSPRASFTIDDADLQDKEPDNTPRALEIWAKSTPIKPGSLGQKYMLRDRGLQLVTDLAWPDLLRFQEKCPAGKKTAPAMIALLGDILTDEPCGIQRTFFDKEDRQVVARPDEGRGDQDRLQRLRLPDDRRGPGDDAERPPALVFAGVSLPRLATLVSVPSQNAASVGLLPGKTFLLSG
jgi:putative DNA primase/helicase